MKRIKILGITLTVALALITSAFFVTGFGIEGDEYETDIDVPWTDVPPTIDGIIEDGEWDDAYVVMIDYYPDPPHRNDTIYIYFMNDADYLYIAVDLLPDNTTDAGDFCALLFDEDDNDLWENFLPDNEAWYMVNVYNYSGDLMPEGWGSKPFLWAYGFDVSPNDEDVEHVMWEFAIPISNFIHGELELGETVGFSINGYGTLSPEWDFPINTTANVSWDGEDASDWAKLTLAEAPAPPPTVVEGWTAAQYAMVMIGIGTLILLVVFLNYKKTILEWVANGEFRKMAMAVGTPLVLQVLGILQWHYDWLSWFGL